MDIPATVLIPMLTTIVGVTSWNVSLHGRVNGHDKLFEEREKQADERNDDVKERLKRIEDKLDRSLGIQKLGG